MIQVKGGSNNGIILAPSELGYSDKLIAKMVTKYG